METSHYVIEVLLPLNDAGGEPFPRTFYDDVRRELTERFGGVTAFVRSPAEGLWKEGDGDVVRDDIVFYEVMADHLDTAWWANYREQLRGRFVQDELIMRATAVRCL
ncbi:MAG TPA: hypothetical protein VK928_02905 [Longimicrobiales bacterium]|nr:hypothetical protein [Longimicrobiales bacterium]